MSWLTLEGLALTPAGPKLLASLVLLGAALAARWLVVRAVLRYVTRAEARRRWIVNTRNTIAFLVLFGLAAVWAEALRTFAVSIVAIAVALVIATKELILCISGTLLRAASDAYSVGDRIEIGGIRGDVIDQTLLATTILEVGPGRLSHQRTGRTIVVPNSLLLTSPVITESHRDPYVVHTFSIPLRAGLDWQAAERELLEASREECAPFLDEARDCMKRLERTHGLNLSAIDPRVSVHLTTPEYVHLLVRIPSPMGRQGRLEELILRRFLARFDLGPRETADDPGRRHG